MPNTVQQAKQWVDLARREGARAAEVLITTTQGWELQVMRGRVVREVPFSTRHIRVRTWVDGGRRGDASGNPDAITSLIADAIAQASDAPDDPKAGPVGRIGQPPSGLGIDDPRYPALSSEDRTEALLTAERSARAVDRRVVTGTFHARDSRTQRIIANSKGVAWEAHATLFQARGEVEAGDARGKVQRSGGIAARSFSSIASLPFGAMLAKQASSLLASGPDLSGPLRVMLTPGACASLFARIAELFDPDVLPTTFLGDPDLSLSRRLHLIDDGLSPGALRTRPFDDRGVPPVPLTLLREGVVDAQFLDPRHARARGTRPTGHTWGNAVGPSNLQLRSGNRSINAILTDLDGPVLKLHYLPVLTMLDPTSGALDMQVSGDWMQGSKVVGAVRDLRLRGKLGEVLAQVIEVASDTDRVEHVDAPGLLIDGFVAR